MEVFPFPPQLDAPHQHDLTQQRYLSGGGVGSPRPEVTLNDNEASCLASLYPTCCLAGQGSHAQRMPRPQTVSPSSPQRRLLPFSFRACLFSKGCCQTARPPLPFHGLFHVKKFRRRVRRERDLKSILLPAKNGKRPQLSGLRNVWGQEVPLLTLSPRTPEILMVLMLIANIQ